MEALDIVARPLAMQLRALYVALRATAPERARLHARRAVALVNEATDLSLTADDLLLALAEGAEERRGGREVLERLLAVGVRRRLEEEGLLDTDDPNEMTRGVRCALGVREGCALDSDPRWSVLLDG